MTHAPRSAPRFPLRPAFLTLAGTLAALGAPTAAFAQSPPSVLELLPTGDRVVNVGVPAEGSLGGSADHLLPDGQPVQAWQVRGEPGSWIWIDLVSEQFDAYLFVFDPGRREILADDDSGGGCHARIPVEIPAGGHVIAIASQVGLRSAGSFTLSASTEEPPIVEEYCAYTGEFGDPGDAWELPLELVEAGTLEPVPGEVTGSLEAGATPTGPMEGAMVTWDVAFSEGQIVQVDLMSEDFDAVLLLSGPGIEGYLLDDDGGEGLNSRIIFTVLVGGTYRLHATGFGADAAGEYRLSVNEILAPPTP